MSERTARLAGGLVDRLRAFVAEEGVTYDDYRALKQWLIDVGEAGEWPLVLDVFIESAVEEQAFAARPGSSGAIEGPYYLPGAPVLDPPYELPRSAASAGEALVLRGRVVSSGGSALPGAVLDVWQADPDGRYSGFSDLPQGELRGKVVAGEGGRYAVRTIRPAPYTIPLDGPTGRLMAECGWNPWRPAHIHLKVSADGHEMLTTQLTLADSDYIDDDPARAVKDDLLVRPFREDGGLVVEHDFVLASGTHALGGAREATAPAAALVPAGATRVPAIPSKAAGHGAPRAPARADDHGVPDLPPPALPAPAPRTWRPALPAERAPRFGAPRGGRHGR
jgi:catechol 1,2-dioxygenase